MKKRHWSVVEARPSGCVLTPESMCKSKVPSPNTNTPKRHVQIKIAHRSEFLSFRVETPYRIAATDSTLLIFNFLQKHLLFMQWGGCLDGKLEN